MSLRHPPSRPAHLLAWRPPAWLPEELRFRERLAASPRPVTAAGGRAWRAQEMDGPSPLPPLPSRFRCCLGNRKQKHTPVRPTNAGTDVAAPLRATARAGDPEVTGGEGRDGQGTGEGGRGTGRDPRSRQRGEKWAVRRKDANFILISRSFFSLAFTKAVGSKRGRRPPRMGGEGGERRLGHRLRPPPLQPGPPPPRAGQGWHRPEGEGEGPAGRPRPRPPRPLSREEERAAPRPREVDRSLDDEALSSRAGCGTTGDARLLGTRTHCRLPTGHDTPTQASFRTSPSGNLQVHQC